MSSEITTQIEQTTVATDDAAKSVRTTDNCDGVRDDGSPDILQPGRMIRPMISSHVAVGLVQRLYGLPVVNVRELNSYDDRNFFVEIKPEGNRNPFIAEVSPHGYVLKVLNSMDSCKTHIGAEHEMQKVLASKGIDCPQPVLNLQGQEQSLENLVYDLPLHSNTNSERKDDGKEASGSEDGRGVHLVRLMTFIPGRLLVEAPYTKRLIQRVGRHLAAFHKALEDFRHPSFENHQSKWLLSSVPRLPSFTFAIRDPEDRQIVEDIVKSFVHEVIPKRGQFQTGINHGDFNEQNILVSEIPSPIEHSSGPDHVTKEFDVCGVLDFSDASFSYYVYDIAILIMYMMLDSKIVDILDVGGFVLAGYISTEERTLNETEFEALKVCVAARYAQSLTLGAYTYSLNPTNEYLLTSAKNGWAQLRRFWTTPATQLYERWRNIMRATEEQPL